MILLTFVDPDCKVDHAGEGILDCIPGFVLHADDAAADDVHSRSMREQEAAHTCAAGNSHGDEDHVEEVGASGVREEACLRACVLRDPGAGTHGDLPVVSWPLPPRLRLLLSLPDSYRCAYRLLSHSTAFPQH
jgi:hypothetical protein